MNRTFQKFIPAVDIAPSDTRWRCFSPLPKVCFSIGFLFLTVSFNRYDWMGCVIFSFVPFILAKFGALSVRRLLRRTLVALPFVLCAGIANLFFDRSRVMIYGDFSLSGGMVSLVVLTAKTLATVGMALTMGAVTPMREISGALARLHVPCLFILQIQLLFRYLFLLMEEAQHVTDAYFLRNPACRIVPVRDWGALVGRLFLRSAERATEVYRAMQCRLFRADAPLPPAANGMITEWIGVVLVFAGLSFLRIIL